MTFGFRSQAWISRTQCSIATIDFGSRVLGKVFFLPRGFKQQSQIRKIKLSTLGLNLSRLMKFIFGEGQDSNAAHFSAPFLYSATEPPQLPLLRNGYNLNWIINSILFNPMLSKTEIQTHASSMSCPQLVCFLTKLPLAAVVAQTVERRCSDWVGRVRFPGQTWAKKLYSLYRVCSSKNGEIVLFFGRN